MHMISFTVEFDQFTVPLLSRFPKDRLQPFEHPFVDHPTLIASPELNAHEVNTHNDSAAVIVVFTCELKYNPDRAGVQIQTQGLDHRLTGETLQALANISEVPFLPQQ